MKTFTKILIAAGVAMLLSSCGVYHGIERVERIDYRTQYRIDRMADHGYYRIGNYYRRRPATPPQRPSTMQPWRRDYGYEKNNPYRPEPGMAPGNTKPQNETHTTGVNTVHTEILHPESAGSGVKVNPETYHKSPVNTGNSGSTKPAEPAKPAAPTTTSTSRSSSTSSATPASTTTSTHSSSTSRAASTSSSSKSTTTRSSVTSGSSTSRTSSSTSSSTPKSTTATTSSSTSSPRTSSASRSSSTSTRTSSSSSTGSSTASTSSTSSSAPATTSSTSTSTNRSSSGSRR